MILEERRFLFPLFFSLIIFDDEVWCGERGCFIFCLQMEPKKVEEVL